MNIINPRKDKNVKFSLKVRGISNYNVFKNISLHNTRIDEGTCINSVKMFRLNSRKEK